MQHIGVGVHKRTSQVCICTEDGELATRKIVTARETFAKLLGSRPRCRIVIEASTESEWVARCLEALGLVPREFSSGERQSRGRITKAATASMAVFISSFCFLAPH